jgi:hypothetical protein
MMTLFDAMDLCVSSIAVLALIALLIKLVREDAAIRRNDS